ncbi:MAG: class I SAM-dependent methyltransferase [Spirochaetia bacterium]
MKKNNNPLQTINEYYQRFYTAESADEDPLLGWEDRESQTVRFSVLPAVTELEGKKLLDIGCGTGMLYDYLLHIGIETEYTGVDIMKEAVQTAAIRHPDVNFIHGDVFQDDLFKPGEFDIVFASGIFNLDLENNMKFIRKGICKMLELTSETAVFNLLHTRSTDKEPMYYYYTPEEVKDIPDHDAWDVIIIDNYLKNDFSVVCNKKSVNKAKGRSA